MLSWPSNIRVFVCTTPTDMRKQFDGLHALVTQVFGRDVFDGHLFLFFNCRRERRRREKQLSQKLQSDKRRVNSG